jgi:hypothetical protein
MVRVGSLNDSQVKKMQRLSTGNQVNRGTESKDDENMMMREEIRE